MFVSAEKLADFVGSELLEWQVDRARQVLVFELFSGQHLDERRALRLQLLEATSVDVLWHTVQPGAQGMPRPALPGQPWRKVLPGARPGRDNLSVMVSFGGGGGGGAALGSPAGILALLVIVALVAAVYWLFNR